MTANNVPTFNTEDSLWQMLVSGEKTWDARQWDEADERIIRLTSNPLGLKSVPTEPLVAFLNKGSGQVATFQYKAALAYPWAPGWAFLLLGARVGPS